MGEHLGDLFLEYVSSDNEMFHSNHIKPNILLFFFLT